MSLILIASRFSQLVDGGNVKLPNKRAFSDNNKSLTPVIGQIISVVLGVLGAIAVLIIVIAGIQYALSSGDSQKISKAKNTIIYALIGLVIAIGASAIVAFVFDKVL